MLGPSSVFVVLDDPLQVQLESRAPSSRHALLAPSPPTALLPQFRTRTVLASLIERYPCLKAAIEPHARTALAPATGHRVEVAIHGLDDPLLTACALAAHGLSATSAPATKRRDFLLADAPLPMPAAWQALGVTYLAPVAKLRRATVRGSATRTYSLMLIRCPPAAIERLTSASFPSAVVFRPCRPLQRACIRCFGSDHCARDCRAATRCCGRCGGAHRVADGRCPAGPFACRYCASADHITGDCPRIATVRHVNSFVFTPVVGAAAAAPLPSLRSPSLVAPAVRSSPVSSASPRVPLVAAAAATAAAVAAVPLQAAVDGLAAVLAFVVRDPPVALEQLVRSASATISQYSPAVVATVLASASLALPPAGVRAATLVPPIASLRPLRKRARPPSPPSPHPALSSNGSVAARPPLPRGSSPGATLPPSLSSAGTSQKPASVVPVVLRSLPSAPAGSTPLPLPLVSARPLPAGTAPAAPAVAPPPLVASVLDTAFSSPALPPSHAPDAERKLRALLTKLDYPPPSAECGADLSVLTDVFHGCMTLADGRVPCYNCLSPLRREDLPSRCAHCGYRFHLFQDPDDEQWEEEDDGR